MKDWTDCSKKEQIERWQNVIRVLEGLTPHQRRKHWDMRNWGVETDCGTIACAAGHCGLDPWFRRRGLKLQPRLIETDEEKEYFDDEYFYGEGAFEEDCTVEGFFGECGSGRIFLNTTIRSVSVVIKEVKQYIKDLESDDDDYVY